MPKKETRFVAKNMWGEQPYQKRARKVLPILVRQALAQKTIYYQHLADELRMKRARNCDYVLGSVGVTLNELGKKWGEDVPEIQSLAVNQHTHQPGSGFFGGTKQYQSLTKKQREAKMQSLYAEIYSYPKWPQVLNELNLKPPKSKTSDILKEAREFLVGGESPQHKRMKMAVSQQPKLVGIPSTAKCLGTEYPLPSGDKLDVCFARGSHVYAVEVKTALSPVGDLARGLFQCVKYQSVLEAWHASEGKETSISVLLALEGHLPDALLPLRNALQIKVVEHVTFQ